MHGDCSSCRAGYSQLCACSNFAQVCIKSCPTQGAMTRQYGGKLAERNSKPACIVRGSFMSSACFSLFVARSITSAAYLHSLPALLMDLGPKSCHGNGSSAFCMRCSLRHQRPVHRIAILAAFCCSCRAASCMQDVRAHPQDRPCLTVRQQYGPQSVHGTAVLGRKPAVWSPPAADPASRWRQIQIVDCQGSTSGLSWSAR